jgi:indolepyruvate ferredoxin oxidoreductase
VIRRHEEFLTAYEGAALATRYRALVERARGVDDAHASGKGLARAVAESYFRLLSPKDEYEVARLYTDSEFDAALSEAFADKGRVSYFMAPAWLARRDRVSGLSRKMRFGPWLKGPLRVLAAMRGVRGTMLDPFRFTAERKLERRHLAEYERDIERILHDITPENFASCVELASLPLEVRGFGHVRAAAKARADERRAAFLAAIERPAQASAAE